MNDTQNITVIGVELLSHGITQEFAQAGYPVTLNGLNDNTWVTKSKKRAHPQKGTRSQTEVDQASRFNF